MEEIMNHDNLMLDVIESLSTAEVPDECLAEVLTAEAKFLSGAAAEEYWHPGEDVPLH